ncbi:gp53-like domain-containing protein [Burkholderia multivorans]|uniref:gp53-like domain-containing protein n=1 Tax=Burkholderia multivorans TaxID=87883 RepID=UPI0011B21C0C|nr:hypothetical protein [Burkholderia multivorans]MCA8335203.1 hypothetical protein [Burkholderia multivorans]MCL4627496.1 hypothetical protein [Burkholderia multivorans]MCO1391007.1 hypothetical protein [Burkholderia multivorans]MDN7432457.1 hypothetical protein [Burkholderia multivorans]UQO14890.1 hypothetical protein L0Z40_20215 [Burkholderia multivorans]
MPSLFTFANNISTTLAGSISSGASSLTLSSAANLPSSIPAGKVLVITLNDVATRQQFEVIYATAISGATLSGLLRGQENTSAQAWSTGDYAYCSPTMGQMQAFGQLADNNVWSGNQTFNGNITSAGTNTWNGSNTFVSPVSVGQAAVGSTSEAVNQGQFDGSIAIPGWKKYPDPTSPTGYVIEQWGTVTTNTNTAVSFPIAFPTACLNVLAMESAANSSSWGTGSPTLHAVSNKTKTGFTHWTVSWNGNGWTGANNTCDWRAWGY